MALKKRSDGRYQVSVQVGFNPETGKPQRKVFYGDAQKEAKAKRDELLRNRAIGLKQDRKLTVAEWATKWLAVYGTGGYSTTRSNELAVRRLVAFMGDAALADVVKSDVQRFADTVRDMSFSSVKKIQMAVQNIFREAVADRLIIFDPTLKVDWSYASRGSHRALSEWEVDLITQHWREHRFGLLVMLMLYAGLRRGEVLALTWGDIDFDSNLIHVQHGVHFEVNAPIRGAPKTPCSVRDVPIVPPLRRALESVRGQSDELICVGAAGQPVTGSIWASSWRAWMNVMSNILNGDTRLPVAPGRRSDKDPECRRRFDIRAHDLRHTFASMLYDAGVDVKTAQRLLGHASPEITLRLYTHLSEQRRQSGIECIMAYTQSNF